ncbi:MAG TPA: hypothetical protein VKV57_10320 [bacterium]|nr:hypothetical protein [bacterium]
MWWSVETFQVLAQDRIFEHLRVAANDRRAREFAPRKARGETDGTQRGASAGRGFFTAVRALLMRRAAEPRRMTSGPCA